MITIHPNNYNKPTPKALKFIADILLLVALIAESAPEFEYKGWIVWGGIAFKLISKFITEHIEDATLVAV